MFQNGYVWSHHLNKLTYVMIRRHIDSVLRVQQTVVSEPGDIDSNYIGSMPITMIFLYHNTGISWM